MPGGSLLGGLPKSKGVGSSSSRHHHRQYIQGEIVAPVYRTRDFDLFTTAAASRRSKALSRLKET